MCCVFQKYYKYHVPGCLLSTDVTSGAINGTQESDAADANDYSDDDDGAIDVTVQTTDCAPLSTILKQVCIHHIG